MIANLVERSVAELLALKANYERRMADSGHGLTLATAQMMSQAMRAVHNELKRRKEITS